MEGFALLVVHVIALVNVVHAGATTNTTTEHDSITRQLQATAALPCNLPSLATDVNANCCGDGRCGHRRGLQAGLSCAPPPTCSLQCASTFVYFMHACGPTLEELGMPMGDLRALYSRCLGAMGPGLTLD